MKIRTLLVDGNSLLKHSFTGNKNTYNSKGHIGAIYTFLTIVRKMIKENMTNKTIVVFDGDQSGLLRFRLDSDYKANRKSKSWYNKIELTESEIRKEKEERKSILYQKNRIQNYIENLFIRQIEIDEIEADDLISQYILEHNNKEELFLSTKDRDYCQLLDQNLTIILTDKKIGLTKDNYMMHFNHHYSNALTIKVICGDSSDNIKGVGGIKEDTLLNHFPELKYKHVSVNDIYKKAKEIQEDRISKKLKPLKCFENLINNKKSLKLNHKLMNLKEPFLNKEAIEELKQLELPLSPEGRSSKELYRLMMEDEFLTIYGGTFVNYIEPFYTVIMNEKQLLTEYYQNNSVK